MTENKCFRCFRQHKHPKIKQIIRSVGSKGPIRNEQAACYETKVYSVLICPCAAEKMNVSTYHHLGATLEGG